jgi:hypothetical protein
MWPRSVECFPAWLAEFLLSKNHLFEKITANGSSQMSEVRLLLNGQVFLISKLALHHVCTNFPTNPFPTEYPVTSRVSAEVFQTFLSALQGDVIEVTKENFPGLSSLSNEFGFDLASPSYRFAQLEATIQALKTDIGRLSREVTALRGIPAIVSHHSEQITQLFADVSLLKAWNPSPDSLILSNLHSQREDSRIISDFLEIFTEFRGKHFELLWRGSRDGFAASEFHRRCDGHPNTLTVILDTKGNIFGGFTPVKWESLKWNGKDGNEDNCKKGDNSQKSFVFTLKNQHNVEAKRFALKAEKKEEAIWCESGWGPFFWDIVIYDNCNRSTNSFTALGTCYINDTGIDGSEFFPGSFYFKVKEIEVFEIGE